MPADPTLPAALLAWLEDVDACWRQAGLDVALRARMTADLVEDLTASLSAGAGPEDLVGDDAGEFARQVATAYGASFVLPSARPRSTARGVVRSGLLGGALGGVAVWVLLVPLLSHVFVSGVLSQTVQAIAVLVIYAICGVVVVGSVLAAIRWRYPADPGIRRTLVFVGAGVLLLGLLSIAPAVGLAHLTSYDASAAGVTLVGLLVLGFVASGIRLGYWVAERTRPSNGPSRLLAA